MDGRRAIGVAAVAVVFFVGSPSQAQQATRPATSSTPPSQARHAETSSSGQVISPLHAFLGIDPVTGEFKPARQTNPTASNRQNVSAANNPSESTTAESAPLNGSEPSTDFQFDEKTIEEFRGAIGKALDEHENGALAAAIANVTRGMNYDQFSLLDPRIERIGYLALFLYPLGIVISELYGVWARRHTMASLERERRFYARQRNRRFTLALFSAVTIGLFWWAGEHSFWWGEPRRLIGLIVGLTLLAAVSALLRLIIARAAKEHVARVIEDLRLQQLALEKEIRELRSRLQGNVLEGNVAREAVS